MISGSLPIASGRAIAWALSRFERLAWRVLPPGGSGLARLLRTHAAQLDEAFVERLLARGAHPNHADRFGASALSIVAATPRSFAPSGQTDRSDALVARMMGSMLMALRRLDAKPDRLALNSAIVSARADCVIALLAAGCDPHEENLPKTRSSPWPNEPALHLVASARMSWLAPLETSITTDDARIARILLAAGADPDQLDQDGNAPLHVAARRANIDIINILLEGGADPRVADGSGRSALLLCQHLLRHVASTHLAARLAPIIERMSAESERRDLFESLGGAIESEPAPHGVRRL